MAESPALLGCPMRAFLLSEVLSPSMALGVGLSRRGLCTVLAPPTWLEPEPISPVILFIQTAETKAHPVPI